jgi:glycosyltransferase involved in cell wall biosynthesis
MTRVGFVTAPGPSDGIFRGMDAYAAYLLPHLQKDKSIRVEAVSDFTKGDCDMYHFPVFSLFRPVVPLTFSRPYAVTVHDVTRLEFGQHYPPGVRGGINLIRQKLILRRAGAVITDSYSSVRQITRYMGLPPSKLKLIYLAAADIFKPVRDQAVLARCRSKYRLPEKFVLCNGDIDWNKNLIGLLTACRKINLPVVLYGRSVKDVLEHPAKYDSSHPELSHLPRLVPLLRHPDVHPLGFVPDAELVRIFNLATVYCQPSFAEGFGIPVVQALACGVPVAASRTHSLPEVAGEAAVYFDPESPDEIAASLERITDDSGLRAELAGLGPARAAEFSWEKTARETIMVYREIAKKT